MNTICYVPAYAKADQKPLRATHDIEVNSIQPIVIENEITMPYLITGITEKVHIMTDSNNYVTNTSDTNTDDTAKSEPTKEPTEEPTPHKESNCPGEKTNPPPTGECLNTYNGVFYGPSGKETYYNLPMQGVVEIMRNAGFSEEEYPYWVREDGVKMLGDYVMVAADLNIRPRGSILECSLGTAIVCDTGAFVKTNPTQLDIAVDW